jgi:hypothetical protein
VNNLKMFTSGEREEVVLDGRTSFIHVGGKNTIHLRLRIRIRITVNKQSKPASLSKQASRCRKAGTLARYARSARCARMQTVCIPMQCMQHAMEKQRCICQRMPDKDLEDMKYVIPWCGNAIFFDIQRWNAPNICMREPILH